MYGLVSIIMPSYDAAAYIGWSIQSVLSQTYANWELIIVDDCSTDNTDEIVKPFLTDNRIKYFKNEQNSGAAVTRNRALRKAKGTWIAFLDSDDLWHPQKLEKQLAFMMDNRYDFTYTNYQEIDEQNTPLGRLITGPKHITKWGMYQFCWPGCLTVMYNAQKIGLIQIPDIKKNNDYALWLEVIKHADCFLLPEDLAQYRKRKNSVSRHGYFTLIKWHYKLFRQAQKRGIVVSALLTLQNLCGGVYKKVFYVKGVTK